jgi:hypothetical protein
MNKGESIRVFPLSNWTELDVWLYIHRENIPLESVVGLWWLAVSRCHQPTRGRRRARKPRGDGPRLATAFAANGG